MSLTYRRNRPDGDYIGCNCGGCGCLAVLYAIALMVVGFMDLIGMVR